jgi:sarcosine oxidase subunit beta
MDAVVIGGGAIGTALTYYLSSRGCAVALIERRGAGSGTSGACGGSITMQTKRAGPVFEAARKSQGLYRGLSDELSLDLEYREGGSLVVAETDSELEYVMRLSRAQQAAGLSISWFNATTARAWGPGLGPSVLGGSYCPTDAEVNPLKVVFGFADAAKRLGATVWTHTCVTGIRVQRGHVAGIHTDRGDITAPLVVNAAGVWSAEVAELAGTVVPVRPLRGVVLVTDVAPFRVPGTLFSARYLLSKRHQVDDAANAHEQAWTGGLVLAETEAGNLLVGSSRELSSYSVDARPEIIEFIVREAVRILPVTAGLQLIRAYAGLRPLSPDGLPVIGETSLPGFFVAAGHEGDGIALAPWTGKAVADLLTREDRSEDLAAFSPRRLE